MTTLHSSINISHRLPSNTIYHLPTEPDVWELVFPPRLWHQTQNPTTPAESGVFFDLEPLYIHPDSALKPQIYELHTNSWSWFCWLVRRVVYHQQLYVRATGAHRERSTNEKLNCVSIQSQQHSHTRGTKLSCMIYAKKILIPKLDVLLSVASIQLQHLFWEKKNLGPREAIHKVNQKERK